MTDLGTLGGRGSQAVAINERGQIVGESETASGETHAFLWQHGTMTDLGTLGGSFSSAVAINEHGQVVGGSSTTTLDEFHAFLWQHGTMTDLGTLGGSFSSAFAINERGQVVGQSTTTSGEFHAFLWQHGTMTDLGNAGWELQPGPSPSTSAGRSWATRRPRRNPSFDAFLWQRGTMTDLETLGANVSSPFAINERGQIVGDDATAFGGVPRLPLAARYYDRHGNARWVLQQCRGYQRTWAGRWREHDFGGGVTCRAVDEQRLTLTMRTSHWLREPPGFDAGLSCLTTAARRLPLHGAPLKRPMRRCLTQRQDYTRRKM